jgi:hypothetical protein
MSVPHHPSLDIHPELEPGGSSDILPETAGVEGKRRLLGGEVEDMDTLDREITETEELLQHPCQRKTTDAAFIDVQYPGTSSFEKFPAEILHEIFLHLCPVEVSLQLSNKSDGYPWILGHVCALWKNVLWTSPSILKNVRIEGTAKTYLNKYHENACTAFLYILSTTRNLLSVHFSAGWFRAAGQGIIVSHNYRFKSLEVHLDGLPGLFSLMDLPAHSFPNLRAARRTLGTRKKEAWSNLLFRNRAQSSQGIYRSLASNHLL